MPTHRRPTQRRHWIFDLDGTLTVAVHDFDDLRRRLGLPPGASILETIDQRPADERSDLLARVAAWEQALIDQATLAPGALKLLDFLADRGHHLGILTRNLKGIALATLQRVGLADRFPPDLVVGREEAPAKPEPGGVHCLLQRWQADPSDAVMVGDYLYDLQAGRRAGVFTVHVGSAPGWPEWTDRRVEGLEELVAIEVEK